MLSYLIRSFLLICMLAFWQLTVVSSIEDVLENASCGDWKRASPSCLGPNEELANFLLSQSLSVGLSTILSLSLAFVLLILLVARSIKYWQKSNIPRKMAMGVGVQANIFNFTFVALLIVSFLFYVSVWFL